VIAAKFRSKAGVAEANRKAFEAGQAAGAATFKLDNVGFGKPVQGLQSVMLNGNAAVVQGCLDAGLDNFFGYPITPSSEIPETLSVEFGNPAFPDFKVFLQASSEIEAINMVIGAAATGAKVMAATSGPGFSLKQEGLSYAASMEIPMIVIDVNRGGPGLGNLGPEQTDYFQATRGGGHGGYRNIVLAPSSVPEMAAFPSLAFTLAFKYRTPVIILTDAFLGQLKEDLVFPDVPAQRFDTAWATTGARGPERHVLSSMHLDLPDLNRHSEHLRSKFEEIDRQEQRSEKYRADDAEVALIAYGICARLAQRAVKDLRDQGIRAGLLRPITLSPFPSRELRALVEHGVRKFLVVELNTGQMVDDVRLAVGDKARIETAQKVGGLLPTPLDLVRRVEAMSR
jgi:2-oxoglutarate ferredoxin oxidoreductase subunit alpha